MAYHYFCFYYWQILFIKFKKIKKWPKEFCFPMVTLYQTIDLNRNFTFFSSSDLIRFLFWTISLHFHIGSQSIAMSDQQVHFELGRSIITQCGNLITWMLYVKEYNFFTIAIFWKDTPTFAQSNSHIKVYHQLFLKIFTYLCQAIWKDVLTY